MPIGLTKQVDLLLNLDFKESDVLLAMMEMSILIYYTLVLVTCLIVSIIRCYDLPLKTT